MPSPGAPRSGVGAGARRRLRPGRHRLRGGAVSGFASRGDVARDKYTRYPEMFGMPNISEAKVSERARNLVALIPVLLDELDAQERRLTAMRKLIADPEYLLEMPDDTLIP